MTQKVIARDRVQYNLTSFVSDIVKNYVRGFLNSQTCYEGRVSQKVATYSSVVTSYNPSDSDDEITALIKEIKKNIPTINRLQLSGLGGMLVIDDCLLNVMGRRDKPGGNLGIQNELNYQIFYAGRTKPKKASIGNKTLDQAVGVFHYLLGKDSGIIKNIQLRRTDATGLKELRFEQEGFDGLQQLREVYNADITTFAYPLAIPGTYIFVDPRGFAPDTNAAGANYSRYDLSQYGIGGYFMINKAETNFAEGLAETKISAVWVAEQEAGEPKPPGGKIEDGTPSSKKCKTKSGTSKDGTGNGLNSGAPQTDSVSRP